MHGRRVDITYFPNKILIDERSTYQMFAGYY